MTVTNIRAGTKATPAAVFEACAELRKTKGDFRNEDVLSKTGGGLGTVGRLVALYRKHESIVAANDALDAEVTITLVEALDKLLKQQISRSQAAVSDFIDGAGVEIAELSDTLETKETALTKANAEIEALRSQLRESESSNARLESSLAERERELSETRNQLKLTTAELKSNQTTHAAKLEQLASQHHTELARAIEVQRKAMEAERAGALEEVREENRVRLAAERADAEAALSRMEAKTEKLQGQLEKAIAEKQNLAEALHSSQMAQSRSDEAVARLEVLVEEKQRAVDSSQAAHRELMSSVRKQLSTNTEEVVEKLTSVASAADNVNTALAEINALLAEIRTNKGPGGSENE